MSKHEPLTPEVDPVVDRDPALLHAALGHGIGFRDIKAFLAVAQCRNISEAARQIHMTQSALSRTIQDIEATLGAELLTRSTRGVRLTDAGKAFYPHAEKLSTLYTETLALLSARKAGAQHQLRLACSNMALPIVLPALLRQLPCEELDQAFMFKDLSSPQVVQDVSSGEADIGICMLLPDQAVGLESEPLLQAPLGLLASPDMKIPAAINSLGALSHVPMVRLSDDMVLPQAMRAAGICFDYYFQTRIVCHSMAAAFSAVQSGQVATLVSAIAAAHPLAFGLKFLPLPHLLPSLQLFMLMHASARLNDGTRRWIETTRGVVIKASPSNCSAAYSHKPFQS